MALIKPKALRRGAMLGIVSPASAAKHELVERGLARIHAMGYRTRMFPSALARGPLNYAGPAEDRVADLHAAFRDPEVDGILCTRGGWGAAELLPHLDTGLVHSHPKALLGYSDITSLHLWLRQEAELVSFQAPMLASDFGKEPEIDLPSWDAALGRFPVSTGWTLGVEHGLRALRTGTARGALGGGCLSIYGEAIGTPYAPTAGGGVLFLEDVGVEAYQWDRMLLHLRYAGLLERVTGIVFGDMRQCCAPEGDALMEETLLYALRDFKGPIGIGLRSGHVDEGNITLPFGVEVQVDLRDQANPRMHFTESAVSV